MWIYTKCVHRGYIVAVKGLSKSLALRIMYFQFKNFCSVSNKV